MFCYTYPSSSSLPSFLFASERNPEHNSHHVLHVTSSTHMIHFFLTWLWLILMMSIIFFFFRSFWWWSWMNGQKKKKRKISPERMRGVSTLYSHLITMNRGVWIREDFLHPLHPHQSPSWSGELFLPQVIIFRGIHSFRRTLAFRLISIKNFLLSVQATQQQ